MKKNRFKKELGALGEKFAEQYLQVIKGYNILERNFTCFIGEIDLVALHENDLVFVEVRSSTLDETNMAGCSIDVRKQKKLRQLAAFYLEKNNIEEYRTCRFDVVIVLIHRDNLTCKRIELIINAF